MNSANNPAHKTPLGAYLAMGLIPMSVLMCEITMTKVLSVLLWFHFGYLIISVALLGLGAAGSYLAVARLDRRPDGGQRFIARCAFGLAIAIVVAFALVTKMMLDPLQMFVNKSNLVVFALDICILTVPFFLAGLCLGWMIGRYRQSIGALYAADLVGGGGGSALAMLGINQFGAPATMALAALLAAAGALFLSRSGPRETRGPLWRALVVPLIMLALFIQMTWMPAAPAPDGAPGGEPRQRAVGERLMSQLRFGQKWTWQVPIPESKELFYQQFKNLDYSRWNAIARIDVAKPLTTVPAFGAGVSQIFSQPPYQPFPARLIGQDGTAPTLAYQLTDRTKLKEELPFLAGTTQSFAYQLLERPRVCVIGVGGGIDVLIALFNDAARIKAVEVNPLMIDVITKTFADYVGRVFADPRIEFVANEGRHFLASTDEQFDVIQMSGVDTFAALASGAYVLAENYLYTREAIGDIYHRLTDNGMWTVSRWKFTPPRESLRLAITAYDELEALGVEHPERHLMVCFDPNWATILMKKSEFTPQEVDTMLAFCERYGFGVFYDPFHPRDNPYNAYIGRSPEERRAFLDGYYYKVSATTDNSPFFFQWYKMKNVLNLFGRQPESHGGYTTTTTPLGHRLLLLSVALLVALSAALILYPLRAVEGATAGGGLRRVPGKGPWLIYFACLGLAFIFAEVVLIQKFIIYLGVPLYSMALVLAGLLVFSGLGSRLSSLLKGSGVGAGRAILPLVAAGVVIDWLAIGYVLPATMQLGLGAKALIAIALIGPLGLLMGMPFPLGIRGVSAMDALGAAEPTGLAERREAVMFGKSAALGTAPSPDAGASDAAASDMAAARLGFGSRLIPWVWGVNACLSVVGALLCILVSMLAGFHAAIAVAAVGYLLAFAMLWLVRAPG